MRHKMCYWRSAWENEEARCEALHQQYMLALDAMSDTDQQPIFYVPSTFEEEEMGWDLWRQHVQFTQEGTWSYIFEI